MSRIRMQSISERLNDSKMLEGLFGYNQKKGEDKFYKEDLVVVPIQ